MTVWTPKSVKAELVQAYQVLATVPVRDSFYMAGGGFWPEHGYESDEIKEQGKAAVTENRTSGHVRYSPADIERMESVLLGGGGQCAWLVRLSQNPGAKRCLAHWAVWTARNRNMKRECRLRGWAYSTFRRRRDQGAELLADALNEAGVEL